MPEVARAFGEGELSESAVHVLASAQEAAPEAFARSEPALVEAARSMAFGELRRVTETWRIAADPTRRSLTRIVATSAGAWTSAPPRTA
jgi:hypothetical protein